MSSESAVDGGAVSGAPQSTTRKNFSGEGFRDPDLSVPKTHQDRRNSFTRVESAGMRRIRLVSGEGLRERTAVSRIARSTITPLR